MLRALLRRLWSAVRAVRDLADPRRRRLRLLTHRVVRDHQLPDWHRSLPWERPYLRAAAAWIAAHSEPSTPILDCGCGLGQLLQLLHERGFADLRGIELRPEIADAARELLAELGIPAEIRVSDAFEAIPASAPIPVLVTTNWHHAVANGLPRLIELVGPALARGGIWLFDALSDPPPRLLIPAPQQVREGYATAAIGTMAGRAGLVLVDIIPAGDRTLYAVRRPACATGTDPSP